MQDMQPQEPELNPEAGMDVPADPSLGAELPNGEVDHEGAMAKADLFKLANYSKKLFDKISDEDQLEAWVQAKITKAADYVASVYHYLEYEMEFSEYGKKIEDSEMYTEGQKRVLKARLMEAKEKVKALKKAQAEKITKKEEVKEEKSSTGGEITRGKGFTRHSHNPKRFSDEPHAEVASKAKSQSAADKAGSKAADKAEEKEGKAWEKAHGAGSVTRVKDGKKIAEERSSTGGEIDRSKKGVTTHKQNTNRFSDEPHTEPKSQAKSRSAAEKAGDKAADKEQERDYKAAKKANPTGVRRYSLGKQIDEASDEKCNHTAKGKKCPVHGIKECSGMYEAAKPDFLDMDKDSDKKEPMKKAVADKKKNPFAKKVDEAKSKKAKKDYDKDGKIESEKDEVIGSRRKAAGLDEAKEKAPEGTYSSKRHETDGQRIARLAKEKRQAEKKERMKNDFNAEMEREGIEEGKPSAGLTKKEKSATVKDAKAGKDIGKPGKNFDKVAKAAGGGEKGEKIAAAAMWKNKAKNNIKEAIAHAKKQLEGSIQNGVWVAQPDKGVPAPSGDPEGVPAKKATDPKKAAAAKTVVKENADLDRMKVFLTRLNG